MYVCTVLPAKSDSDVMSIYKVNRDLELIAHLCTYPICRVGLIPKCSLDLLKLKWSVHVNVLHQRVYDVFCLKNIVRSSYVKNRVSSNY